MTSRSTRLSARVQRRVVGRSIAAAIAGSAVAAVPASAFVLDAPEAGQNISVFHNLDFVAVFGYPADGTPVQVDVMRGAHRIGTVSAPAVVTPDGPGLEINHGPEGTPVPGDCFAGLTPDVRPGDEIVVRSGADAHEDRIRVDHLTIDGDPVLRSNGDIAVSGTAARADATRTPIHVTALDSAEFRDGKFRGVPTRVERTPGTTDGWTAIYEPPYLADRNDDNLDLDGRRLTLLGPIHTMGYGHVEVLPAETQLFEGAEASGPAPGCEAAPGQANVVNAAGAVTGTSGDLQVTGTAMAHTLGATDAGGGRREHHRRHRVDHRRHDHDHAAGDRPRGRGERRAAVVGHVPARGPADARRRPAAGLGRLHRGGQRRGARGRRHDDQQGRDQPERRGHPRARRPRLSAVGRAVGRPR